MKAFVIVLLCMTTACTQYQLSHLNGKWFYFDAEDGYSEVWYRDGLELIYDRSVGEIIINKVSLNSDKITYTHLSSYMPVNPKYSVKILELNSNTLTTEYIGPTLFSPTHTIHKLTSKVPEIYPSVDANLIYLDEIVANAKQYEDSLALIGFDILVK